MCGPEALRPRLEPEILLLRDGEYWGITHRPLKTEMVGQNYRVLRGSGTCYSWGTGIGKRGKNNMKGSCYFTSI